MVRHRANVRSVTMNVCLGDLTGRHLAETAFIIEFATTGNKVTSSRLCHL